MDNRYKSLLEILCSMESLAVAFSGGVDSTLLLKAAHDALGKKVLAITIDAPFHTSHEIADARRLASIIGVRHLVISPGKTSLEELYFNPPDRCYICKLKLFGICLDIAAENGLAFLSDGSNIDDLDEYRPGRRALEELGVRSPLVESGLGKAEIRESARKLGLDNWNKPAMPCLLTRFRHGAKISDADLLRLQRCEKTLRDGGFGLCRVRVDGDTARIELAPEEMTKAVEPGNRKLISETFRRNGFAFVTLDLDGYRTGSMNL